MAFSEFHPIIQDWFNNRFEAPTNVQNLAWPAIFRHQHTLISAPTGSGKTLAAFLASIDQLLRKGLENQLKNETQVLYISPLKALSNDIEKNLQDPLQGISNKLLEAGLPNVSITAQVRTGDTSQNIRAQMRKRPPHILVTTPESLHILLTSDSGRKMLATVKTVIVDEIHAVAGNKRGAHLALSLERLAALCNKAPTRIGLSATQNPIEKIAMFLIGNAENECEIVNTGHTRERDIAIETTSSPLDAIMENEVWGEIYNSLEEHINNHKTTLIFVNTRRLAERAAHALAERLGEDAVTSHHGSLAKEHRLEAEEKLKSGKLKALVATASLELGIDIGDIDLVCQLGSPRSISTFLQRVGRSGHSVDKFPKGRLYPLSRDDLIECTAIIDAIKNAELDRIEIPSAPLDVLAQHIIAEVANCEWSEERLYQLFTCAYPYQDLKIADFKEVITMLADGFTTRRGRRGAYLHWDRVNKLLRGRRGAKTVAVMNSGSIPDHFDYNVVLQPEGIFIGSLNEDFAFESLPGDVFLLGNTTYRMLKVEQGKVYVEDAQGQSPNIPFWFGESPGRTDVLSGAVSRLREHVNAKLNESIEATTLWLIERYNLSLAAAAQISDYLAAAKATFETVPSRKKIVFERFFDDTGDMHIVIHSCFGSRINRAWGLALRKRFCRKFNFELQAAATDDNIILSLGATHSFELQEVVKYLNAKTVRNVLLQALLTAPMFPTRWRWVCNISLAVPRMRNGKRVPAPFQRNDAEDLLALVFPDQLACQENIIGEREIPDHPLVNQALIDCTTEVMDIEGLEKLLRNIKSGVITVVCKDLATPSMLAQEILNARPYAFLDDTPAEERRTRAVQQQRFHTPEQAADIGRLHIDAIEQVKKEAWPEAQNADELHDALTILGYLTPQDPLQSNWKAFIQILKEQKRALKFVLDDKRSVWIARERLQEFQALFPQAKCIPNVKPLADATSPTANIALQEIIRSRLEGLGPATLKQLNQSIELSEAEINKALLALEQEGFAIRGHFTPDTTELEWCDRGLLARIHRYTLKQLRKEVKPVSQSQFMQFLFHWQHLLEPLEGQASTAEILMQLEGVSVSAYAWEKEVLPARVRHYSSNMLDNLSSSGRFIWMRLKKSNAKNSQSTPVSITPISILPRSHMTQWLKLKLKQKPALSTLKSNAKKVLSTLKKNGASFFLEIVQETELLRTQCEIALAELVACGLATSDSFAGLRALAIPESKKPSYSRRRNRNRHYTNRIDEAGRWSLIKITDAKKESCKLEYDEVLEIAKTLLYRYGVVFRKLLEAESCVASWRELLYAYRRMEARGEIRGGRFVQGFSGEQFALPDAIGTLRALKIDPEKNQEDSLISIAAVDPLNLTGIITPGNRVPALSGNRILYRNGIPIAVSIKGDIRSIAEKPALEDWEIRNALLKQTHKSELPPELLSSH